VRLGRCSVRRCDVCLGRLPVCVGNGRRIRRAVRGTIWMLDSFCRGIAMIDRRQMIAVLRCRLFVVLLFRCWRMLVLLSSYLIRSRLRVNAALAPVVAHVIVGVPVDNRFIHVGIVDHRSVDVGHGGVVAEGISVPSPKYPNP